MNEQLSLFDGVIETKDNSITESVIEKKRAAIQRYLDSAPRETIACVNKYQAGKCDRYYYRLSYRVGRGVRHIHIRGGNVNAELAQYRAEKLQSMIDRGAELEEVIAAVKTYNSGKK